MKIQMTISPKNTPIIIIMYQHICFLVQVASAGFAAPHLAFFLNNVELAHYVWCVFVGWLVLFNLAASLSKPQQITLTVHASLGCAIWNYLGCMLFVIDEVAATQEFQIWDILIWIVPISFWLAHLPSLCATTRPTLFAPFATFQWSQRTYVYKCTVLLATIVLCLGWLWCLIAPTFILYLVNATSNTTPIPITVQTFHTTWTPYWNMVLVCTIFMSISTIVAPWFMRILMAQRALLDQTTYVETYLVSQNEPKYLTTTCICSKTGTLCGIGGFLMLIMAFAGVNIVGALTTIHVLDNQTSLTTSLEQIGSPIFVGVCICSTMLLAGFVCFTIFAMCRDQHFLTF